jgi:hypothetical protein
MKILKQKKIKKTYNIVYADIENDLTLHTPFIIGFNAQGNKKIEILEIDNYNKEDIEYESDKMMKKFIMILFRKFGKKETIIYFHNLRRFDGIFLLDSITKNISKNDVNDFSCIIRDNKIYEIKYKNLHFRDSLNILSSSLNSIAFNLLGKKKDEINYQIFENIDSIKKNKELIIKYLEKDVILLEECMTTFEYEILKSFDININTNLTISGLAFRIYRTKYMENENI